jgi:hypothetical protein
MHGSGSGQAVDRRAFLGGSMLGGAALSGMVWPAVAVDSDAVPSPPARRAIVVQPVLLASLPQRRAMTSWRNWGGVQTEAELSDEQGRIGKELRELERLADFPMTVLPLVTLAEASQLKGRPEAAGVDAYLVYAAGGQLEGVQTLEKPVIIHVRHTSGPVSLWYEIVSPRFLRQHTDEQKLSGILPEDVVVDRLAEVVWRLRSLCGLVNTRDARIVAIGGADAWAQPKGVVPALVKKHWNMEIIDFGYDELEARIKAARADARRMKLAESRAMEYLGAAGLTLQTERRYVVNAFVLDEIFREILGEHQARAITVNQCMGTIMPISDTTACLSLSLLNDDGYLAFCESDFVVIPAGMLLANISGRPVFLNDPTYPHEGVITLAHCTAPRRMDGSSREPVRIVTHFESDFGAAPQVKMKIGQPVTNVIPDFASQRWVGFLGTIAANTDMPICRSQIDVAFDVDASVIAERMRGFHWITLYGDLLRETGYALRRIPIAWEKLA